MGKRRDFDRALLNEDVKYVNYDVDDIIMIIWMGNQLIICNECNEKVNAVDVDGHTALIWAADKGNVEVPKSYLFVVII